MTDHKGMQLLDKMTRHHIFNSRYWKEQCFALNAETFIDKAINIKYVGGLYSGSKKPTKFLCLILKLLQMNLSKQIAIQYLKARQYKYLNALALFYLRLILHGVEAYETLEPFYNDNRKLCIRNSAGQFSIIHIDEFVDQLLRDEIYMGVALPFLQKRSVLQDQELIEPRVSMLQAEDMEAVDERDQMEQEENQDQDYQKQAHQ